mmetsp:Transcript_58966/g.125263  ORF Transcript_58966/g.125263 Transcript_58966/m.125263 type:complete len:255 (+) Transcript_58966:993-1757(+)
MAPSLRNLHVTAASSLPSSLGWKVLSQTSMFPPSVRYRLFSKSPPPYFLPPTTHDRWTAPLASHQDATSTSSPSAVVMGRSSCPSTACLGVTPSSASSPSVTVRSEASSVRSQLPRTFVPRMNRFCPPSVWIVSSLVDPITVRATVRTSMGCPSLRRYSSYCEVNLSSTMRVQFPVRSTVVWEVARRGVESASSDSRGVSNVDVAVVFAVVVVEDASASSSSSSCWTVSFSSTVVSSSSATATLDSASATPSSS